MVDHALTLLLADEPEAALRWGAAALQQDPSTPSALVVTSRLLEQMGRTRAAIEGLQMAVRRAVETGNVPLAIAAIDDLRSLGVDISEPLDRVAEAFCRGSSQLEQRLDTPAFPDLQEAAPLSPFLAGPSLASKATQILRAARDDLNEPPHLEQPLLSRVPLFSALPKDALRELLGALEMVTVPAGHLVVQEGEEAHSVYFVARGECEVSRRAAEGDTKPRLILARLGAGSLFGEMSLLGKLPSAASVRATRPSILLVGRRDVLEHISEAHPETAHELAAHCRRHVVSNLGWASPVVAAIPAAERAMMVERLQTRVFKKGETLVSEGEESQGLYLVVSGEVAVVGRNRGERVVLATLLAGETVGEVELVLCRTANADAIAVKPTATLFLPRGEFYALVQDQPAILHGLYGIAVQRHTESQLALEAGSTTVVDEWILEDNTQMMARPALAAATARHTPPGGFAAYHSQAQPPEQQMLPGRRTEPTAPWHQPERFASSMPATAPTGFHAPSPMPSAAAAQSKFPSYAPLSAPVTPPDGSPTRGRVLQTLLPAAAAVAALAASVVAVLAVRDVRNAGAVGAATATVTATSHAVPAPAPPAAALAATASTESPQAPPAAALVAPSAAHPKFKGAKGVRPKQRMTIESPTTASSAIASTSAAPNATANAEGKPPAPTPKPPPEPKLTAAAAASAEDFGGRE